MAPSYKCLLATVPRHKKNSAPDAANGQYSSRHSSTLRGLSRSVALTDTDPVQEEGADVSTEVIVRLVTDFA